MASLESKMAISFEALLGLAPFRPFLDAKMAISLEASVEIRPFWGGPGASPPKFGKISVSGNVALSGGSGRSYTIIITCTSPPKNTSYISILLYYYAAIPL